MVKEVTVENMTIEDARARLPRWLITCAILENRGFGSPYGDREHELTQRAYELLGNDEYKRIFDKTVEETTR